MALNPVGYVCPMDGGNPRIFTGVAFEAISGGQMVHCTGAADAISSGLSSYKTDDIGLATGASGLKFNGIAIQNVSSGNPVGIATRGAVIVRAGDTIVVGQQVASNGADDVVDSQTAGHVIGRSMTDATSGNFVLIDLNP